MYYRIICKGEGGIYEAYKNSVSQNSWKDFLESKDVSWLPKPKLYGPAYESYFTEKGYNKFCGTTINLIRKNIENGSSFLNEKFFITIAKEIPDSKILYKDEYQVITKY